MNITEMLEVGENKASELIQDERQGHDDNNIMLWHHAKWLCTFMLENSRFVELFTRNSEKCSRWQLPNQLYINTNGKVIW